MAYYIQHTKKGITSYYGRAGHGLVKHLDKACRYSKEDIQDETRFNVFWGRSDDEVTILIVDASTGDEYTLEELFVRWGIRS